MEDLKKECIEAMEELVEKSDLKPGQSLSLAVQQVK